MSYDKQALLAAVNTLILEPDPRSKLEALDATAHLARRYPVSLTAELAVLDPLLQLMATDPETFRKLQTMVDSRRKALDFPPCWPPVEEHRFDKNSYQAQLMRERRERAGRALKIENMQRPEKDALRGNVRLDFEDAQIAKWGTKLREIEETARLEAGGRLSRPQLTSIKAAFWKTVDAQLDDLEEQTRLELLKPTHSRRKISVR